MRITALHLGTALCSVVTAAVDDERQKSRLQAAADSFCYIKVSCLRGHKSSEGSIFIGLYLLTCGNTSAAVSVSPQNLNRTVIPSLGPGRRDPKSHSSCSSSSYCWYQFSLVQKSPIGFLNTQRSATKLCIHIRADIPHRSILSRIFTCFLINE